MPRLTPRQIAQAAFNAGFRGAALVEIVAVAMAESGGNPRAINNRGEFSVGLTQINMNAHGTRFGSAQQLQDPVSNMRAAFQLSRGGRNFRPWSVHSSSRSPHRGAYLRHVPAARTAARAITGVSHVGLGGVARGGHGQPVTQMPDTSGVGASGGQMGLPAFEQQQELFRQQQEQLQKMMLEALQRNMLRESAGRLANFVGQRESQERQRQMGGLGRIEPQNVLLEALQIPRERRHVTPSRATLGEKFEPRPLPSAGGDNFRRIPLPITEDTDFTPIQLGIQRTTPQQLRQGRQRRTLRF